METQKMCTYLLRNNKAAHPFKIKNSSTITKKKQKKNSKISL
jgi:hypothetical protein